MIDLLLNSLMLITGFISLVTAFGILILTIGSLRYSKPDINSVKEPFSVICSIRDEDDIMSTVKEMLQVDNVEEFILSDDTPGNEEKLEKYFDGRFKWFKRQNKTEKNQKHVSLNIAKEKAEKNKLIVMDIDSEVEDTDVTSYFSDENFAAGKVPPLPHSTIFGLYEKIDNNIRQSVFQPGRDELELCPNLPGCFYFARKEPLQEVGYESSYDDFFLTLNLYQEGMNVRFVDEIVARQDIPDSLKGMIERRKRWFNHFWRNSSTIIKKIAKMPDLKTMTGIILYPLIWYLGFYSLLTGFTTAIITGNTVAFLPLTIFFLLSYTGAAFVSQKESDNFKALSRSIYYTAVYSVSLTILPFYSVFKSLMKKYPL